MDCLVLRYLWENAKTRTIMKARFILPFLLLLCKPSNAKELFSQKDIDGGLIGGASLKADDFIAIAKSF